MDNSHSYAKTVRQTLWETPIKAACCRRAFLYGLLLRAEPGNCDDTLTLSLPVNGEEADFVCMQVSTLLRRQLG